MDGLDGLDGVHDVQDVLDDSNDYDDYGGRDDWDALLLTSDDRAVGPLKGARVAGVAGADAGVDGAAHCSDMHSNKEVPFPILPIKLKD